ncbi:MAG: hypothetical protein AAGC47_09575 [Bacteroidota bacterium]
MKGLLIGLFVVAFAVTGNAQTKSLSKMKKNAKSEVVTAEERQNQVITDAIMEEGEVQTKTLEHLLKNEDTKEAMTMLSKEAGDSKKGLLDGLFKNEMLTTAALDYVKNNPELLEKAMKMVGM